MKRPTPSTPVTDGADRTTRLDLPRFRVSHAVFPPDHRIPSHFHERACVSVILRGRFLQAFPTRECDCRPAGVIVKPGGARHEDRWYSVETSHLIVEPDPERRDELGDAARALDRVKHVHDPGLGALAEAVRRELAVPGGLTELSVESLVLDLLVRLVRGRGAEPDGGVPPEWLERVRESLHDRYAESVRLADLAREAGVHPSHLSRSFSRFFGTGLGDYLRALRIAAARRELETTDRPIARIALRTGFSDQSHLTRWLKRATGMTPGQYRAAHRHA